MKKHKIYFDKMFRYPLDDQQRIAVLSDEDYMLVAAGAGSGKTVTIQAKVKYLVKKQQVPPQKILLLAFNKSAEEELRERICGRMSISVNVHTFHSFGLSVVKDTLGSKNVLDDRVLDKLVKKLIIKRSRKEPDFAKRLLDFSILYQIEPKSRYDFKKIDNYFKMLGNVGYTSVRRAVQSDKALAEEAADEYAEKMVLQGERVRSYEELMIANYLFINVIEYEYERVFPKEEWGESGNKPYTPDFYLPEYDLYWEHFGVDKQNRPSYMKNKTKEDRYIKNMEDKRKRFRELGRDLIESYSWYFSDGKIYQYLDEILEKYHIKKNPADMEKIVEALLNNAKNRLFNQSVSLIKNYLSLYKSRCLKKGELEDAKRRVVCNSDFEVRRKELFFNVFAEIYDEYEQILEKRNEIDFNDMIVMAIEQIQNKNYIVPFDYIIVDEYQDMSYSRQKLLESLVLQKSDTKLFGVGDDWQSIYGFTGSDLDYFTGFEKYWPHALQLKIERTHRNSQQLVDIAGNFIMKNPQQIKKNLKSGLNCDGPVLVLLYDDDEREEGKIPASENAVLEAVKWLKEQQKGELKDQDILILGRNNATVDRIASFTKRRHQYNTVHRSKGSQAEAVILADVLDGIAGFPNQMTYDQILKSLLAVPEQYPYAQERRLFYVALTRTKKRVVITSNEQKLSCFVQELMQETEHVITQKAAEKKDGSYQEAPVCEWCKRRMVLRKNRKDGSLFWGCSNYFGGCRNTQSL